MGAQPHCNLNMNVRGIRGVAQAKKLPSPAVEPRLLLRGKRRAKPMSHRRGVDKGLGVAPEEDWTPFIGLEGTSVTLQRTRVAIGFEKKSAQARTSRSQGLYRLEKKSTRPEIFMVPTQHFSPDQGFGTPCYDVEMEEGLNMFIVGGPLGGWGNTLDGRNSPKDSRGVVHSNKRPYTIKTYKRRRGEMKSHATDCAVSDIGDSRCTNPDKYSNMHLKRPVTSKERINTRKPRLILELGQSKFEFRSPGIECTEGLSQFANLPKTAKESYFEQRKFFLDQRRITRKKLSPRGLRTIEIGGDALQKHTPSQPMGTNMIVTQNTHSRPVSSLRKYKVFSESAKSEQLIPMDEMEGLGAPFSLHHSPQRGQFHGHSGQLYRGKLVEPFLQYKAQPPPPEVVKEAKKKRNHIPVGFQNKRGHILPANFVPLDDQAVSRGMFCDIEIGAGEMTYKVN